MQIQISGGCVCAESKVINGLTFASGGVLQLETLTTGVITNHLPLAEKPAGVWGLNKFLINTALLNSPGALIIRYKHGPPEGDNRTPLKMKKVSSTY